MNCHQYQSHMSSEMAWRWQSQSFADGLKCMSTWAKMHMIPWAEYQMGQKDDTAISLTGISPIKCIS